MSNRLGFEHLSKRFGVQTVFEDFSLDLPLRRASCLMGPSGSGKTTLLRLLMKLELPDLGRVHTLEPLSVVFQEDRLLPGLCALDNLLLVTGREGRQRAGELLNFLQLGDEPQKPVSAFSGGMKRRVAIARALLVDAPLLLLDEPFKGLDEHSRQVAADTILGMSPGKTIVLVTHDPQEARLLGAEVHSLA